MPVGAPSRFPLSAVRGVRLGVARAGVRKPGRRDLVILELAPGSRVAARFTRNAFCAAPVTVAREHLAAAPGAPAAPQPAEGEEPGPVSVKKQELMEIASDMGRLMTELKPQPYKDASGKMVGITSPDLGKVPLAKKVGLADNDVITAINGMSIDSVESIGKIAEKFKNLNVFHLKVLRNGQTVTRTIKLE